MSIRADSPSPAPADMFLISGDYQNLKRALGGSTVFPFPFGLVSEENLEEIARGDITGVPGPIAEQATKELSDLTDISPVILDILLDGAYLRHLLLLADLPRRTADVARRAAVVALATRSGEHARDEHDREHDQDVDEELAHGGPACGAPLARRAALGTRGRVCARRDRL